MPAKVLVLTARAYRRRGELVGPRRNVLGA
jgi:hypothetical protein